MIIQIIASIAVFGVIYFILNQAIKNLKYNTRSIINLSVGVVLGFVFYIALNIDRENKIMMPLYYYYILFATSIGIGLILFVFFLVKDIRFHGFRVGQTKAFEKKEYLYLVYTHNLNIFLENKTNKGVIVKLNKRDFHDEKIKEISSKLNVFVSSNDYQKIGECIIINDKGKELIVYHAYLIKLVSDIDNSEYNKVDKREITKLSFKKIDKQIIFRSLLEEEFCIKINKKEVGD